MLDEIQQQFDEAPYPPIPIERPIPADRRQLYPFCAVNAFYARDRQLVDCGATRILDAGCGTGYRTIQLAAANPGAPILGIDWSGKSLEIARRRAAFHGVSNARFICCSITDVGDLEEQFDYVNCNDALYLTRAPAEALRALGSVLAPRGIIRADLHNARQRSTMHRAQEFFRRIGVMTGLAQTDAAQEVRRVFDALNDRTLLKAATWRGRETDSQILANHLLRGDHSYRLDEVFSMLNEAGLQFIGMVDSPRWNLDSLFKGGECRVDRLLDSIQTREDYFLLCDLLNCRSRLYDFWCGHREVAILPRLLLETDQATVHLHPMLNTRPLREVIESHVIERRELRLAALVPYLEGEYVLGTAMLACIYPLWFGEMTLTEMVTRFQALHPVSPLTLKPEDAAHVNTFIKGQLLLLERYGIVHLVESNTCPRGPCREVSGRPNQAQPVRRHVAP